MSNDNDTEYRYTEAEVGALFAGMTQAEIDRMCARMDRAAERAKVEAEAWERRLAFVVLDGGES